MRRLPKELRKGATGLSNGIYSYVLKKTAPNTLGFIIECCLVVGFVLFCGFLVYGVLLLLLFWFWFDFWHYGPQIQSLIFASKCSVVD